MAKPVARGKSYVSLGLSNQLLAVYGELADKYEMPRAAMLRWGLGYAIREIKMTPELADMEATQDVWRDYEDTQAEDYIDVFKEGGQENKMRKIAEEVWYQLDREKREGEIDD